MPIYANQTRTFTFFHEYFRFIKSYVSQQYEPKAFQIEGELFEDRVYLLTWKPVWRPTGLKDSTCVNGGFWEAECCLYDQYGNCRKIDVDVSEWDLRLFMFLDTVRPPKKTQTQDNVKLESENESLVIESLPKENKSLDEAAVILKIVQNMTIQWTIPGHTIATEVINKLLKHQPKSMIVSYLEHKILEYAPNAPIAEKSVLSEIAWLLKLIRNGTR